MVTAQSGYMLKLYNHYKNGVLFSGGGLADQLNLYVEAMEFIEGRLNSG